jgi:hypothetical protein
LAPIPGIWRGSDGPEKGGRLLTLKVAGFWLKGEGGGKMASCHVMTAEVMRSMRTDKSG